jgi:hypothetical protein
VRNNFLLTFETAPFFCVYPVDKSTTLEQNSSTGQAQTAMDQPVTQFI